MARLASDWERGVQAIRALRLRSPHEPVGWFRLPKDPAARDDLADAVYDLTDEPPPVPCARVRPCWWNGIRRSGCDLR